MANITELKQGCMGIIKNAPDLPSKIKELCVYEEVNGKKVYPGAYVPFIGQKYGQQARILFYGMAQNLGKVNTKYRKEYAENPQLATERLFIREADTINIDMGPIASGVIPALTGLCLFSKGKTKIEDLAEVLQCMSATNFYKFSLWKENQNDLHPEMVASPEKEEYTDLMLDEYVSKEIKLLQPDYIFAFRNYPYEYISRYVKDNNLPIKVFKLNDTAWMLRIGEEGMPKDWKGESLLDKELEELLDSYCEYIREKAPYTQYRVRTDVVKIYLRHYCHEILGK